MSTTPIAAEAAQQNQQFWQGIAQLPESCQRSFWDAGACISQYIGENPSPRTLQYDNSRPPADYAWWQRILFYVGQSHYNQSVANLQTAQAMNEGASWLWGALQGDFNKSPTTGQVITGGVISMIPVVDQIADVRDIIANALNLSDAAEREKPEAWTALGLTCIGFVPLAGSAVKTVGKVVLKEAKGLLDLLKVMEWLEKQSSTLRIAIPWGRAPMDWLRRYDWQGAMRQAADGAKAAFHSAKKRIETAIAVTIGAVQAKLKQLSALIDTIISKITGVLAEIGSRIKQKIDEWLGGAKQEAGNYGATPGGPNRHGQGDREPPRDKTKPRGAPGEDHAVVNGKKVFPKTYRELYHGTNKATLGYPESMPLEAVAGDIYKKGLPSRGNNIDLAEHAKGADDRAFRGTTTMLQSPDQQAGAVLWADEGGLVIKLQNVKGYDVNEVLEGRVKKPDGTFGGNSMHGEQEIAVPGAVKPEQVETIFKVIKTKSGRLLHQEIER